MFYKLNDNNLIAHIEKSGCESVMLLVAKENNIINHNNKVNIFSHDLSEFRIGQNKIHKYNNLNHIYIVRNPYRRLVSAYLSKVCCCKHQYDSCWKEYFKKNNFKVNDDDNLRLSFEDFINGIIKLDKNKVDNHFKPQHLFLNKNNKNRTILKLEDTDLNSKLKKKAGLTNNFISYNLWYHKHITQEQPGACKMSYNEFDVCEKRPINERMRGDSHVHWHSGLEYTNAIVPKWYNFYNDDLKSKVYNYYNEDFIEFEYSQDFEY